MATTPSPLRYPGGKANIASMVSEIIKDNDLCRGHYAEPYAGGGGLALSLLFKGHVHYIHLNDLDRSIWCFWNAILKNTEEFISRIESVDITLDEWYRQREIQKDRDNQDNLDVAFSTFFLNRTNRSGVILKAGVIGGLEQDGKYKLDCRFNKKGLIDKILRIKKYKNRIHVYNLDAIDFIKATRSELPTKTLYCIDPPYFVKGSTLYTNFYNPDDHKKIATLLNRLSKPWILTYDDAPEIQELYKNKRQYRFNLNYSAGIKRVGTELLITSDKVSIPPELNISKMSA